MEIDVAVRARGMPAEGPHWDPSAGVLWWVDINGRSVHRYDPTSGRDESVTFEQEVGVVVPRAQGGLVAGVRDGFAWISFDDRQLDVFHRLPASHVRVRMNDGKCDAAGRMWAGTMAFDASPGAGRLYRLDAGGGVAEMLSDVTISNGMGWSLDGATMYYIDTRAFRVDAFDFDVDAGTIAGRRTLAVTGREHPDGMCVDADGCLWVAFFGASCVRRYTPAGAVDRTIELPVAQVTSCAFGGSDLGDLYITTAATRLSPDQLEQQPLAGSVFVCRPGAKGLPANVFAG